MSKYVENTKYRNDIKKNVCIQLITNNMSPIKIAIDNLWINACLFRVEQT